MISTLFVVAANVAILTMPHSSPSHRSSPSIDLQCYDMGVTGDTQELRCYRKIAPQSADGLAPNPSTWWCKQSFYQASKWGPRPRLYCADREGHHTMPFGDFIK